MNKGKFVRENLWPWSWCYKISLIWNASPLVGEDKKWRWCNDMCPYFLEMDSFTLSKTSKNNSNRNHSSFQMSYTSPSHYENPFLGYCIFKLQHIRNNKGEKTEQDENWGKEKPEKGWNSRTTAIRQGWVRRKHKVLFQRVVLFLLIFSEVFNLHVLK